MPHPIRPAEPADIPTLLGLIAELAAHHGDIATITAAHLHRDLFGPIPWISVLLAGNGAGYAMLVPFYRGGEGSRCMELHHLHVRAACRSQGIGRALVAAACDNARDYDCTLLTVGTHPDNTAAQLFYERLGFTRRPAAGPRFGLALG